MVFKNSYYILTALKNKSILCSTNYQDCFDFIIENPDTKIRIVDFRAIPTTIGTWRFLRAFHKNMDDLNKLFVMADILIKGKNYLYRFFRMENLSQQYKAYRKFKYVTL